MSLTATERPTRQAMEAIDRSAPGKVTGKLKRALDAMVWDGACRADAAQIAGMTDHSLRSALKKPHVKRYYLSELEVLRTSARARAHFRMTALSEQDDNKAAAVTATKHLLSEEDQQLVANSARQSAGITIVIETGSVLAHDRGDEVKPLIEHEPVRDTE